MLRDHLKLGGVTSWINFSFVHDAMHIRCALRLLFAVHLLTAVSYAGWGDANIGQPVLVHHSVKDFGADENMWSIIQEPSGRILTGSNQLYAFDGDRWVTQSRLDVQHLRGLALDPDGVLWAGMSDNLGYFSPQPGGKFKFTSLLDHLEPTQRPFKDVWACGRVREKVYFVCTSKVLAWDGVKFEQWVFPTKLRLFPVRFDGEIWFEHQETGLYRFGPQGPILEYSAAQLPDAGPMWVGRVGTELYRASNDGVFRLGETVTRVSSKEVSDYLRENVLTAVAPLPTGGYALSTIRGGILVVDNGWSKIRALTVQDGIPSNAIYTMLLDRENILWCTSDNGVFRIDASAAVSRFTTSGTPYSPSFFVTQGSELFMGSTLGVLRLSCAASGRNEFQAVPGLSETYFCAAPFKDGLLLGRYLGLDLWNPSGVSQVFARSGSSVGAIFQSKGGVYLSETNGLSKIQRSDERPWQPGPLIPMPLAKDIYEDEAGKLWLSWGLNEAIRFDPIAEKSERITEPVDPLFPATHSRLVGFPKHLLIFSAGTASEVDALTAAKKRIDHFPRVETLDVAYSPSTQRVHVLFKRLRADDTADFGLGFLQLDAEGRSQTWHEKRVTGLRQSGVPYLLFHRVEEGRDALWVGGSECVLRLRPDELPLESPPAAPRLWLNDRLASPSPKTFAFDQHHLRFTIDTPEISQRKFLHFETRLGNADSPWSDASPQHVFEYTNLSDGAYEFAIRAVNAAGLKSEPVIHHFRIEPPRYRSLPAYVAYGVILIAGSFIYFRLRNRRVLQRNRLLETQVIERTAQLVAANAAKDEFLAGISHEIRNPMNGVVGLASALDPDAPKEDSRTKIAHLRHCATHLSKLLEDILDFSKLQADAITLDIKPFNVRELAESVQAITSTESSAAGIAVDVMVTPEVPPSFLGDAARIRQILLNFVLNALRYAGQGTIELTVWCASPSPAGHRLTFAVSDEGPGMDVGEQQKIFSRFQRGSAAKRSGVGGAGLGLSLCKILAEKMGGELRVESEPGHGTTFFLELTLAPAPTETISVLPTLAHLRALVVDDEEYNRVAMTALLTTLGLSTESVGSGEEALVLAQEQTFDVIFLDLDLPDLSGFEVARRLRRQAHLATTKLIAATGYSTQERRAEATEAGMDGFVSKPVTPEKLLAVLGHPTPSAPAPKDDWLDDLRRIATYRGITLAQSINTYLLELTADCDELHLAVHQLDAPAVLDLVHRLHGRFALVRDEKVRAFISPIEQAIATGDWAGVTRALEELRPYLEELSQRLRAAD